jgi:outer membrane receptor protein involved in Fe transport
MKNLMVCQIVWTLGFAIPATAWAEDPPKKSDDKPAAEEKPAVEKPADASEPTLTEEQLEALMADDQGFAVSSEDQIEQAAEEGEVINITGTAIQRKEVSVPAPIIVVSDKQLKEAGLNNVGDILKNLPATGGLGATTNNNSGSSLGANQVSLRGMGAERTLVLLNGRRIVPSGIGADAVVDLNVIPTNMIERVEVLQDGASTAYGADAVGGVVNIITKRNYKGVEADIYTGTTHEGGGTEMTFSVLGGLSGRLLGKRSNLMLSAVYSDQRALRASDREWASNPKQFDFTNRVERRFGSTVTPNGVLGSGGGPGNAAWANTTSIPSATGLYTLRPGAGWSPFQPASPDSYNDEYNPSPELMIRMPTRRFQGMVQGEVELHEPSSTRFFVEGLYTRRESNARMAPEPFSSNNEGLTVSSQNVYNPFGRDFSDVRRRLVEFGPRATAAEVDTFNVASGFEGGFGSSSWRWGVDARYGRTNGDMYGDGALLHDNLAAAVGPSFYDAAQGRARCGTPGAPIDFNADGSNCVPLDLFGGPNTITPEMIGSLGTTRHNMGDNELWGSTAKINGKILDTPWGGDLRVAFGGEYRHQAGSYTPDPRKLTGNKADAVKGSYDSREGFAEVSFVPVAGKIGAKWLQFDGALRVSDYENFGTALTWKGGVMYNIIAGIGVRGTYSTSFRAPNVGDLYGGQQDSYDPAEDPCATVVNGQPRQLSPAAQKNCAELNVPAGISDSVPQKLTHSGSNPDLNPETAKVLTLGLTWEPDYLPFGLAISADYFNIRLVDQIDRLSASVILENCYEKDNRNQKDCDKVIRRPDGTIAEIFDLTTNTPGGIKTQGIEAHINVLHGSPIGQFLHRAVVLRTLDYTLFQPNNTIRGVGQSSLATGVTPKWEAQYMASWSLGPLSAGGTLRYLSGVKECQGGHCGEVEPGTMPVAPVHFPSYATVDLFGAYKIESGLGDTTLTLGVENVGNVDPILSYAAAAQGSPVLGPYDEMGRFYYLRLAQTF